MLVFHTYIFSGNIVLRPKLTELLCLCSQLISQSVIQFINMKAAQYDSYKSSWFTDYSYLGLNIYPGLSVPSMDYLYPGLFVPWTKTVLYASAKVLFKIGMGDTDDTSIYRDTKISRYWYRICLDTFWYRDTKSIAILLSILHMWQNV